MLTTWPTFIMKVDFKGGLRKTKKKLLFVDMSANGEMVDPVSATKLGVFLTLKY